MPGIVETIDKGLFGKVLDALVHEGPNLLARAAGKIAEVSGSMVAAVGSSVENIGDVAKSFFQSAGSEKSENGPLKKLGRSANLYNNTLAQTDKNLSSYHADFNTIQVPNTEWNIASNGVSTQVG